MRLARHGSQSTLLLGVQRFAVWLPVRAAKRFRHFGFAWLLIFVFFWF